MKVVGKMLACGASMMYKRHVSTRKQTIEKEEAAKESSDRETRRTGAINTDTALTTVA